MSNTESARSSKTEYSNNRDFVSIIVTTYNGDKELEFCLRTLLSELDQDCEIIIADDGSSDPRTRELIDAFRKDCPVAVKHAWHDDDGARKARARNNAARLSTGNILLFLDHDVLAPPGFLKMVRQGMVPGWFAGGRRVKLDQAMTHAMFDGRMRPRDVFHISFALKAALRRLQGWRYLFPLRDRRPGGAPQSWRGMASFCLAVYRDDFLAIDGFDHRYTEYTVEDWDLFARLVNIGIKPGYFPRQATLAHVWHPEYEQDFDGPNYRMLNEVIASGAIKAKLGISTLDSEAPDNSINTSTTVNN